MNYFIGLDGQPSGPYSREEVAKLLREGRATPNDLHWREGLQEWEPLSSSPAFFSQQSIDGQIQASKTASYDSANGSLMQTIGYCCAAIGFCFLPLLFGPVGIVLGVITYHRKRRPHGLIITILSAVDVFAVLLN